MKWKKFVIFSFAATLSCCCLPLAAIQAHEILVPTLDTAAMANLVNEADAVEGAEGDYAYCGLEDGTVEIKKYLGTAQELAIPAVIAGKSVSQVGEEAFCGCDSLANVTIPEGVAVIKAGAFRDCPKLAQITIPQSVSEIDENVFDGCEEAELWVHPGSYAEAFAKKQNLPYQNPGHAREEAYGSTDAEPVPDNELNPGNLKPGQISERVMKYDSIYNESRQMANVNQNGVYFLNDTELVFYSLETARAESAYTFSDIMEDAYDASGKLYALERRYDVEASGYKNQISIYNLDEKTFEGTIQLDINGESIGVDGEGRIYLAGMEGDDSCIYLLSPQGELLSKAKAPGKVYDFGGFDGSNGNFYFEHYYNWYYWGYEHDMHALGVGTVKSGSIQVNANSVALISQNYFFERQRSLDVIGDKYLCMDRSVYSNMEIWLSAAIDPENPKNQTLFSIERNNEDADGNFDSLACVGTRTVYHKARGSVITYKDRETLAEYVPETGKLIGEYKTSHPVFSLMNYGDRLLAVEKEGSDFFVEVLDCNSPTYIKIQGASDSMAPAAKMQLTVSADGSFQNAVEWSSNNQKVVSVNQSGEAFAWRKGTAVITAKTQTGLTAQYTITVTGTAPVKTPKSSTAKLAASKSKNISSNTYTTYGQVVNSYLAENADGTFTRLECISGKVVAETFDGTTKKLKSKKTMKEELSLFGGFFSGEEYNYIAYGQANLKEKKDVEVLRIVKYSKSWERIASASVYGANTYVPFESGCLRMAEADGRLYLYTCHLMYAEEDGYHHQANMTYVIKESDMSVEQSYYDVLNISQSGYVSHSFNQFVQTDGEYVYRVDHGDAYPRAVSITRCEVGGDIEDVAYALPFPIGGNTGDNDTGVSVGGFELSSENCLIAGNSVPQGKSYKGTSGQRNIFVTVTAKDLLWTRTIWITKHKGNIEVGTPHLVKLGADQLLLMWEERSGNAKKNSSKLVTIDSDANLTSDIITCGLPLSDCKPTLFKNGLVQWYTTDNDAPNMHSVNPYDLEAAGKASSDADNGKNKVKVKKISVSGISQKIAAGKKVKLSVKIEPGNAANKSVTWKSSNTKAATVDQSGTVTMKKGSGGKAVKITATAKDGSGVKSSYQITSMKGVVKKIRISGKKSVKAGKTLQLKAAVTASKGANKKLKWTSSNPKYAAVSSSGKVKAYKAGKGKKVKITAQATDGSGKKEGIVIVVK